MIERQTIDGRGATIAYITSDFEPATPDTAQFVKILFDDGEMITLQSDGSLPSRVTISKQSLAIWAKIVIDQDTRVIKNAISAGLTAGLDNTDIAHQVIGSRRLRGYDGATETTRQSIIALGRRFLQERKSRMSGA